jgi:hypothetical protein
MAVFVQAQNRRKAHYYTIFQNIFLGNFPGNVKGAPPDPEAPSLFTFFHTYA